MNILVTGSEGFLGKHLCELLEEKGHMVEKVDMQLGMSVKQYCEKPRFKNDFIIHLAAHTQVGWCWKHPQEAMENNVSATLDMLNLAVQNKTPIIVVTSDKVFAGGEEVYLELSPQRGYCPYSASKVVCDQLAQYYLRFVNAKTYVVRFSNLIGTDDHNEARLFPQIRKALKNDTVLPFLGRHCVRDWLDVRDAAKSLLELLTADTKEHDLNIVGEESSVGRIVDIFNAKTGKQLHGKSAFSPYFELDKLTVKSIRPFSISFKREYSLSDTIDHCLSEWGVK